MKNLGTYCWMDDAGVLHVDVLGLCQEMGVEPTEANQRMFEAAIRRLAEEKGKPCETIERRPQKRPQ